MLYILCIWFVSRSGKNCNHAHSREEVLYHPTVYKTTMCDTWNCSRYYCPFAHSVDEVVSKPSTSLSHSIYNNGHPSEGPEDVGLRQLNFEDFWEDNDFDDLNNNSGGCSNVGPNGSPIGGSSDFEMMSIQMRRVVHRNGSGGNNLIISSTNLESSRIGPSCLPSLSSSLVINNSDPGWITLTPGLRVELVIRAISLLTGSELCLGTARAPWESGAASNSGLSNTAQNSSGNRRGQQQATMVVKIIPIPGSSDSDVSSLMNQLQSLARSDHKNILCMKKIHLIRRGAGGNEPNVALAIAYEKCSTSLYTTVAEGYRHRVGRPRGLAGRLNAGRSFTPTSATVGKVGELLSAVQRFHSLGLSHCRICPSNIFIDADANLKLGDCDSKFGLGVCVDAFLSESVAAWMAPEAAEILATNAQKKIDWKRADVFSTGLCVFFALTGQHLFATFADEEKTAAAGAAAICPSGLFVEGRESLLSNMHSGNLVNQHLLYTNPSSLDLVLRMVISRTEVGDLLNHPFFWDFYGVARFVTRLPWGEGEPDQIVKEFCQVCPVPWTSALSPEEWRLVLGEGGSPMDFRDTVYDLLKAIRLVLAKHKASGCGFCNSTEGDETVSLSQHTAVTVFVSRIVARFPSVLIRAWDAQKISSMLSLKDYCAKFADVFTRNHLSWMSYLPRLIAQPDGRSLMLPSHSFVREYYLVVDSLVSAGSEMCGCVADESPEIMASIVSQAAAAVASSPDLKPSSVDPSILSSMVNSFGAMMRSDMLPSGVPRSFVMSLIEAAGSQLSTATSTPSPHAAFLPSPMLASGVYYSTVMKPAPLPSGSTTAVSSPGFNKQISPSRRRMSSMDGGWEYAVACPPTMLDALPLPSHTLLDGEDDESPPPGFQTVWQSMADDGL